MSRYTAIHNFKWVKIIYICLTWDQKYENIYVQTLIPYPIRKIHPAKLARIYVTQTLYTKHCIWDILNFLFRYNAWVFSKTMTFNFTLMWEYGQKFMSRDVRPWKEIPQFW